MPFSVKIKWNIVVYFKSKEKEPVEKVMLRGSDYKFNSVGQIGNSPCTIPSLYLRSY